MPLITSLLVIHLAHTTECSPAVKSAGKRESVTATHRELTDAHPTDRTLFGGDPKVVAALVSRISGTLTCFFLDAAILQEPTWLGVILLLSALSHQADVILLLCALSHQG
jgi:hypothetical protein